MTLIVSLIITTYNWPEALKLTLNSALQQSQLPDEIIIADDGSTESTHHCIQKIADESPVPIFHSWQENKGFRAAMSRNRAIAKAKGDYVIVIDGDLILHPNFIEDHLKIAEKKVFIQGGRVLLQQELSLALIRGESIKLSLFTKGIKNRKNVLYSPLLSKLFSYSTTSLKAIKGCNFSLFKEDIFSVNGFDNKFVGWGREDSEFVARLMNAGVTRKNLKFAGIAYHLYHPENPRSSLPENDQRLQQSINEKRIRCDDGIDKFLKSDKYYETTHWKNLDFMQEFQLNSKKQSNNLGKY